VRDPLAESSQIRNRILVRITSEISGRALDIDVDPVGVMLLVNWRHSCAPETDRRPDMTRSMFKLGIPLALALAAASGAAVAQEKDQTSEITIQGNPVVVTKTVGRPYSGEPIERYTFKTAVSYANLDLSTAAGANELKKRVRETAKMDCEALQQAAGPVLLLDDDRDCAQAATAEAMIKVKAAISAANSGSAGSKQVSPS
jgi:UrcA family protein